MDLAEAVNALAPAVLGAVVGSTVIAYVARRRTRTALLEAARLAGAFRDTFEPGRGVIFLPLTLALSLVSQGWRASDVERLAPLVADAEPALPAMVLDGLHMTSAQGWPGRNSTEQVDWLLAMSDTSFDAAAVSKAREVAAPYLNTFGPALGPVAYAAGLTPAECATSHATMTDGPTLLAMAALRGRSGFSASGGPATSTRMQSLTRHIRHRPQQVRQP